MSMLTKNDTSRGFGRLEFEDLYGEKCSLQESSRADEEGAIWLGTEGKVSIFTPYGNPPWEHYNEKELAAAFLLKPGQSVLYSSRMHLSQSQVTELLPFLQHFAEHGRLP